MYKRQGEGTAIRILEGLNCDIQKLRKLVEESIKPSGGKAVGSGNMPLVKQAEKILKITYLEAKIFKSPIIGTEHLLFSILKDKDNVATKSLHEFNIDYEVAKEEFENLLPNTEDITPAPFESNISDDEGDFAEESPTGPRGRGSNGPSSRGESKRKGDPKSKTPVLDNFGRDLSLIHI